MLNQTIIVTALQHTVSNNRLGFELMAPQNQLVGCAGVSYTKDPLAHATMHECQKARCHVLVCQKQLASMSKLRGWI